MRRCSRFVPSLLLLFSVPVAAQQPKPTPPLGPNMGTRQGSGFYVSGFVRDAQDHSTLEGAQVELPALAGPTVARAFATNGTFRFDNIGAGTYNLVVEHIGYEAGSQQVGVVLGAVGGVRLEPRRVRGAVSVVSKATSTASQRELLIAR